MLFLLFAPEVGRIQSWFSYLGTSGWWVRAQVSSVGGCEWAGTLWVDRFREEASSFGNTPPRCRCWSSRPDSRSGKLLWLGPHILVFPCSSCPFSLLFSLSSTHTAFSSCPWSPVFFLGCISQPSTNELLVPCSSWHPACPPFPPLSS